MDGFFCKQNRPCCCYQLKRRKAIAKIQPPVFSNDEEFCSRRFDRDFWWPYVQKALCDTGIHIQRPSQLEVGIGGTYPTFLYGENVIKLLGHLPHWKAGFQDEKVAHEVLAADSSVLAPSLRKAQCVFPGEVANWPYLITTRIEGVSWHDADLDRDLRIGVAEELGAQVKRISRLPPQNLPTMQRWRHLDVVAAVRNSSFPQHLIPQVSMYLSDFNSTDEAVVHGDLFERHIFVKGGLLTGIIDWGDTMFCDRHYEIPKLFLSTFKCDKELLQAFLTAANWPIGRDFSHRCMAMALYRQAIGSEQHFSNDVFYLLPSMFQTEAFPTITELADTVFGL